MQEYLKQIEDKADKAIMYATKVLMTMPKLMAKIDSLEEKVKLLGESVGNINDGFEPLCADVYKEIRGAYQCLADMDTRINSIDVLINSIPTLIENTIQSSTVAKINELARMPKIVVEEDKPKRNQTDYGTYVKVKDLSDKGYLEKEIATELGIPYTTVRAYLRWTDAQIAKKKQQWEEKENKSPEPEVSQPYTVTEEQRQAYIDTHVPTPKFYPDKEEQIELPLVEADDEYEQIEAILSNPAPTVEFTHFVDRTIQFSDWTQEDRENNSFDNQYLPTGKDMVVIIRREDAYSMPYAVKELDWSAEANHPIDGWRLANEQEQGIYISRCVGLM